MIPPRKSFPLSRRRLLKSLAAGGVLSASSSAQAQEAPQGDPAVLEPQPWSTSLGPGVEDGSYGLPAPQEAHVVRRTVPWLTADPAASVSFTPLHELEGILTPNGLCFERHHSGIAEVEPGDHRLMIHGMVERPLIFTMGDLLRFPRESHVYFLECAANTGMEWRGAQLDGVQFTHGMLHCVEYVGVPLRRLLAEAGLRAGASWLLVEGADGAGMSRSLPLAKALDDCLVAFKMNGEALRPEQGYPLRLVVPGWEGNLWIKWLRRIEVGDAPWGQREETSRYTELLPGGKARRRTFEMEVKSVVTNPSPQAPVRHGKGPLVVSGLAWSGAGRVTRVDVSLDGGRNWRPARFSGLDLPFALRRFYLDVDWDGSEWLIQSRAMDEAGRIQPSRKQLQAARGVNSIYHNNAIQTWRLAPDGALENVDVE